MSLIHGHLLATVYTLIVLIISCIVVIHSGCIQDNIHPSHVPKRVIDYHVPHRPKRAAPGAPSIYRPLRIHLHYELDVEPISEDVKTLLNQSVERAANFMSNVFSVVPVQGRLLLAREACQIQWGSGPNKYRCRAQNPRYNGETCGEGTVALKIPDSHLEGFSVYNSTYPEPITTYYQDGQGVDADFIMYVTAMTRRSCLTQGSTVLAFAKYCQQDQYDRPIAASINFCPFALLGPNLSPDKLFLTAVHEFFHSLGFTKDLYNSFKKCRVVNDSLSCSPRSNIIQSVFSTDRLATPAVSEASSRHFGCTLRGQAFGVVLEKFGGAIGSHWDGAFMQGSIMASTISEPHLTVIDNITLALFEDMGWYHVDYSYADEYLWGKGAGCEFGLQSTCWKGSDYFCSGSGAGCHYLHKDVGVCSPSVSVTGCKLFTAKPGDECFLSDNSDSTSHLYGEVFNDTSRCFMSNLTLNGSSGIPALVDMAGRCFHHRCNTSRMLQVQLLTSDWLDCPFGATIEVPGYRGVLTCPRQGVLCEDPVKEATTTISVTSTSPTTSPVTELSTEDALTTLPSTTTTSSSAAVRTEVTFKDMQFSVLEKDATLKQDFQQAVVSEVVIVCELVPQQIANVEARSGSVIVVFDILPPTDVSGVSPSDAFDILTTYVAAGNFSVTLGGGQQALTASSVRSVKAVEAPSSFPSGAIVAIVLGGFLAVTGVVVTIVLVYKYKNRGRISPSSSRAGSAPPEYVIDNPQHHESRMVYNKTEITASVDSLRSLPSLGNAPSQEVLVMDNICRKRAPSVESHVDRGSSRPVSTQGVRVMENGDKDKDTLTDSVHE